MVIITGASKGIGKYLFEKFNQNGVDAIGTYLTTLPDSDYKNQLFKIDVSDYNEVFQWIHSILNSLNNIVLINNAGITYNSFTHKSDPLSWHKVIETNLFGTFNIIRNLLPLMREQNYGRIINISSVVAQKGTIGNSAYAASKSALWGLTKVIAKENAIKNITINTINLGYMNMGMINQVPEKQREEILKEIPQNKFGDPIEIYNTINYIVQSEYLTGTSIDLNGGLF